MTYLNNQIGNINPATPTKDIGEFYSKGGAIVLDQVLGFPFKFLMVSAAGDINVLGIDDNTYIIPNAQPGVQYRSIGKGVLTASTTATGIHWFGGY